MPKPLSLLTPPPSPSLSLPMYPLSIVKQIVFYIPERLATKPGYNLRTTWALWNLLLSAFSAIGMYRTVPYLAKHLISHGFHFTTCEDPRNWFLRYDEPNPVGFWVTLFIYSKIPELIDTIFLVFQKKPVIFLHWFHHVTVLLYCWHAFSNWTASGLWFVAMNFSVHSVMYFYYFLSISGFKSLAKPLAPLITSIQMIQMIVGCLVTYNTAVTKQNGGECAVNSANYKLGLAMYGTYFGLFAVLFYNLYLKQGGKHNTSRVTRSGKKIGSSNGSSGNVAGAVICGVEMSGGDAAGFFHTRSSEDKKKDV